MKNFVAKRLAKQNWNDVAVDLIENVKVWSLKMHDYESFIQSEFELINVKKEDLEIKINRFHLILKKFEEAKEKTDQIFSMNNPLIKVYARFDTKCAEIFDSVALSIRIFSEIDFDFSKLFINFNEKAFNKEIYDEDGNVLKLKQHQTFQNDTTIFIKSQIVSDLILDHIVLKTMNGQNTLSLVIKPTPDINIDNLIFGNVKGETDADRLNNDDERDGLRLKISDTRQKIDCNINYKNSVFLGELIPIDFTFKWRPAWEIVNATLEIIDNTYELPQPESPDKRSQNTNSSVRKSTSLPVSSEFDNNSDPFEVASRSSIIEAKEFEIYYVKPTNQDFIHLPIEENEMDIIPNTNLIDLSNFDEEEDVKLRVCIKFFTEGPKFFKVKIKYNIIKVYEDSKSDPISMTMNQELNLNCNPPFLVTFDYQVKDWLTNDLNFRDSEIEGNDESFVKIPIDDAAPLSVRVTSISEKSMTIKNISLDIIDTRVISLISQDEFYQVNQLEEEDTVCRNFLIQPLQCENDTGQFADVVIEWFRVNEHTGTTFRSICKIPTPSISIVSSPLYVNIHTDNSWYKLYESFTIEVEIK